MTFFWASPITTGLLTPSEIFSSFLIFIFTFAPDLLPFLKFSDNCFRVGSIDSSGKSSLCTLNNLKKIRAIAIFKKEIGISPPQAYLLLHCGISSVRSLSLSTPYELERKIGRLERTLRVKTELDTTFILLKEWIKKASQIDKSIWNLG